MTAFLLALARRYWLPLVLIVTVVVSYELWAHAERALGAAQARQTLLVSELRAETHRADSLGHITTARVDTFTRWRTRWTTSYVRDTELVASLNAALDSMRRAGSRTPDTAHIAVPVRVVLVADSTIHACTLALDACAARFSAESTLADGWKAKALTQPRGASALSQFLKIGLGVLGGYALGRAH